MVFRIAAFQALQDSQTIRDVRLMQIYALKTPGQGTVLFQMVAKLFIGSGADAADLTAGKRRFQQIGGIHGAAGRGTGPHDSMDFVDKQNGLGHGLEGLHYGLEAAFEITAVAGSGQHQAHVQGK